MGAEVQLEREIDPEEEAERIVEAEEELRETLHQSGGDTCDATTEIHLNPFSSETPTRLVPVVGGERTGDQFVFKALVEGEVEEFAVKWPSDPTNSTEPLVRLADWAGVAVHEVSDIDPLPVLVDDETPHLVLPPASKRRRVEMNLSDAKSVSWSQPTMDSLFERVAFKLTWASIKSGLVNTDRGAVKEGRMVIGGLVVLLLSIFPMMFVESGLISSWLGWPFIVALMMFGVGLSFSGIWADDGVETEQAR